LAFAPASKVASSSSVLSAAKSKSVPFIDQPAALTGKLPGDVGFDPLGLSSLYPDVSNHFPPQ
jgi:light-harvesting complex I chlorophyll a/b binding protein 1